MGNTTIIAESVHLNDFRCFESFSLGFNTSRRRLYTYDPNGGLQSDIEVGPLTVLVAQNGKGKTTVLDALRCLLYPFVKVFMLGPSARIVHSDLRRTADESLGHIEEVDGLEISCNFRINESEVNVSRELMNGGKATNKGTRDIESHAKALRKARLGDKAQAWPLVAFYGTGRLWGTRKGQNRSDLSKTDVYGYENCLDQVHDFRSVRDWLTKAVRKSRQEKFEAIRVDRRVSTQTAVVCGALNEVLKAEGYSGDLSTDVDTEELVVRCDTPSGGVFVPVNSLSDGVKAVFSLTADIALRCVRLNPQFDADAAKLTDGIVMIDEVDLHLHPSWQQKILTTLQKCFPRLQFIVTTHSPQVVSAVPKECIRILTNDGGCKVAEMFTEGAKSSDVMADVFGVPTRVSAEQSEVTQLLKRYSDSLDRGDWDEVEGQSCWRRLNELIPYTPILVELEMERHMREYERSHPDETGS